MPALPALLPPLVIAALVGCSGAARLSRTTSTTSSEEAPRRPATSRTIDDHGFVDAAGRPSSETSRTELSGMRATELGSERPTGTPGKGAPLGPPARPPRGDDAGTPWLPTP